MQSTAPPPCCSLAVTSNSSARHHSVHHTPPPPASSSSWAHLGADGAVRRGWRAPEPTQHPGKRAAAPAVLQEQQPRGPVPCSGWRRVCSWVNQHRAEQGSWPAWLRFGCFAQKHPWGRYWRKDIKTQPCNSPLCSPHLHQAPRSCSPSGSWLCPQPHPKHPQSLVLAPTSARPPAPRDSAARPSGWVIPVPGRVSRASRLGWLVGGGITAETQCHPPAER